MIILTGMKLLYKTKRLFPTHDHSVIGRGFYTIACVYITIKPQWCKVYAHPQLNEDIVSVLFNFSGEYTVNLIRFNKYPEHRHRTPNDKESDDQGKDVLVCIECRHCEIASFLSVRANIFYM